MKDKIQKITDLLNEILAESKNLTAEEQTKKNELTQKITNLTNQELAELANLGNTYLTDKTAWIAEKKALETTLTNEKKRLSEELINKLESLTSPEAKLSEADKKELIKELKPDQPNNLWSIGACALSFISFMVLLFSLISNQSKPAKEPE